jgi:monoterpene epsilon-lactone hydrolase
MGDSAGAYLSIMVALAIRDRKLPTPAGVVSISGGMDYSYASQSWTANSEADLFIDVRLMRQSDWFLRLITGQKEGPILITDPQISPLYADLRGLAPLFLFVGEFEVLVDENKAFYEKALQAGVRCKLEVAPAMCHIYPAFKRSFPESAAACKRVGQAVRSAVASAQPMPLPSCET